MQGVPPFIVDRHLEHLDKADPAYGRGVREALERQRGLSENASITTSHAALAG